jgi:energy-coupling factor transport system ATP-binding protein
MRLLKPDAGKILFDGQDVTKEKTCEIAKSIGYVFQNPDYALFENRVRDEVRFGAKNCGIENGKLNSNVRQIALALGIAHLLDRDPSNLSVGEKRRVNIASVLAMDPKIIILDEPDTGLDRLTSLKLMSYLAKLNKESGTTVLIISHNLELVDGFCNKKIFIENGKVSGIADYYARIAEASR